MHPIVPIRLDESLRSRFWAKVDQRSADECWEWTAYRNDKGYGRIGRTGGKAHFLAPRVSWTIAFGDIPDGLIVCHHCDNPPCVNPAHLFLGTHKDNADDRETKGRSSWLIAELKARTACARGNHPLSGDNLYITPSGSRSCRACRYEDQRAAALAAGAVPMQNRTHCPQGHEYSGDNLVVSAKGWRSCRECERKRGRDGWKKRSAKAAIQRAEKYYRDKAERLASVT